MDGFFFYSNSTGGYCLQVCPKGYLPDHYSNQCVTSLVDISAGILVAARVTISVAFAVSSVVTGSTAASSGISSFGAGTMSNIAAGGIRATMAICLVAIDSLANMQYLNLYHSNIALTISDDMSSSFLPNSISEHNTLEKESIIFYWGIFEKNEISALYPDNFGDSLEELLIYFGIFLVAALLKSFNLTRSFGEKAYIIAFGYFISNIFGMTQGQILYSLLQLLKAHLLYDKYCILSLLTAISTLLIYSGVLIYCLFKLVSIFKYQKSLTNNKSIENSPNMNKSNNMSLQMRGVMKKFAFLFDDYKNTSKLQFFFEYWIIGYSISYILLIFCFQSIPILQCVSITLLTFVAILFPAKFKPFKERTTAFLYFFNFACILIANIMNLALACTSAENPTSFSEPQGWVVVSIIFINMAINALFSVGGMVIDIYERIKLQINNIRKKTKVAPMIQLQTTSNDPSSSLIDPSSSPIAGKITIVQLDSPNLESPEENK